MLTPKTFSGVSFCAIDNDKDVTKDRNLNTFKMYCKRRKSGVRFSDSKAKNRFYACHCIAGHVPLWLCFNFACWYVMLQNSQDFILSHCQSTINILSLLDCL